MGFKMHLQRDIRSTYNACYHSILSAHVDKPRDHSCPASRARDISVEPPASQSYQYIVPNMVARGGTHISLTIMSQHHAVINIVRVDYPL